MIPDRAAVKLAKGKAVTVSGIAVVSIKIPAGGRKIAGGKGWFENQHADDWLCIEVVDEDNILGQGAGYVAGSYTDMAVAAASHGWYIPHHDKIVNLEKLVEFGTLLENLYLKITAEKGDLSADTFRCNLFWGEPE